GRTRRRAGQPLLAAAFALARAARASEGRARPRRAERRRQPQRRLPPVVAPAQLRRAPGAPPRAAGRGARALPRAARRAGHAVADDGRAGAGARAVSGVVMLAIDSPSTWMVFDALDRAIGVDHVVVEEQVSGRTLLAARARRLGWRTAAGQAAFRLLIQPLVERMSRRRARE